MEEFEDGSVIRPLSRDEYEYIDASGRALTIYAGLTGKGRTDREIATESFTKWVNPAPEDVPQEKQTEIRQKLMAYFDSRGVRYSFY